MIALSSRGGGLRPLLYRSRGVLPSCPPPPVYALGVWSRFKYNKYFYNYAWEWGEVKFYFEECWGRGRGVGVFKGEYITNYKGLRFSIVTGLVQLQGGGGLTSPLEDWYETLSKYVTQGYNFYTEDLQFTFLHLHLHII